MTVPTRHAFENLVFFVQPNGATGIRLFFALKKKYFNAVQRNLLRRRIKEFFRTRGPKKSLDITVAARRLFDPDDRPAYMDEVRKLAELIA